MRHGTTTGYRNGCRELCCRRAVAAAAARRRRRHYLEGPVLMVSPLGTHRRIQALVALGWPLAEISRRAGYENRTAIGLILRRQAPMRKDVAKRVDDVYRALSMLLPPEQTATQRRWVQDARALARSRGWAPPLAWDDIDDPAEQPHVEEEDTEEIDPVVVERILGGDWHLPATKAEKLAVYDAWEGTTNELVRLTGWALYRELQQRRANEVA